MYIKIQIHTYVIYMYMYSVDFSIHYIKHIHKVYTEATGVRQVKLSSHGWKLASGEKLASKNKMKEAGVIFIKHLY